MVTNQKQIREKKVCSRRMQKRKNIIRFVKLIFFLISQDFNKNSVKSTFSPKRARKNFVLVKVNLCPQMIALKLSKNITSNRNHIKISPLVS